MLRNTPSGLTNTATGEILGPSPLRRSPKRPHIIHKRMRRSTWNLASHDGFVALLAVLVAAIALTR